MKRYHDELGRIRREHQRHLRWIRGWPKEPVSCKCDQQAGRFRKRKALDCGHAKCFLCHGDKLLGIATHKDRLADLRYAESLEEAIDRRAYRNCAKLPLGIRADRGGILASIWVVS